METKQLAVLLMSVSVIAACGGGSFLAAPGTDQDAAQTTDSGKDSKPEAEPEDAGLDAKSEQPAKDATEEDADAPIPDAAVEAEADAVSPDVVEPDVIEADADPCPDGGILNTGPDDCGQIPNSGLWICVIVPHIDACGTVGVAGANPPLGLLVDTYWNDPMIVTGGPCIAPSNSEDSILCKLQAPPLTTVQFAPGLHNGSGPTIPDRFACDGQTCRGRVHVYKDGTEVGGMQNSAASGIVTLVAHQGRLDIAFTAP
ncbi:hypothetical protein HZC53_04965 [Candidatus Uhrbacteria bacterium]|nr:hypothetical protein [Candidatus Uhrbacteria bacterium]